MVHTELLVTKYFFRIKRLYHTVVWCNCFLYINSKGGESNVRTAVRKTRVKIHIIHSMPSWHVEHISIRRAEKRYVFFLLRWRAQRRHVIVAPTGCTRKGRTESQIHSVARNRSKARKDRLCAQAQTTTEHCFIR